MQCLPETNRGDIGDGVNSEEAEQPCWGIKKQCPFCGYKDLWGPHHDFYGQCCPECGSWWRIYEDIDTEGIPIKTERNQ